MTREPLVPVSMDLRRMPRMPLDVQRLRDSDISRAEDAEGFRCAVLAWCVAWHQLPASSLPDDDRALADLLGVGRTARAVKEWQALRPTALRGFVKCSDGRLYHPVIAEIAIDTWRAMLDQRWKSDCARRKKHGQRTNTKPDMPDFTLWITCECPEAMPYLSRWTGRNVPGDTPPTSLGQDHDVPGETASKGKERILPSKNSSGDGYTVAGDAATANPGRDRPKSTPRAHGNWRHDPQATDRKMRELGLKPGTGESMESCVRRIDEALAEQRRASA
jgi:hypothetical protein